MLLRNIRINKLYASSWYSVYPEELKMSIVRYKPKNNFKYNMYKINNCIFINMIISYRKEVTSNKTIKGHFDMLCESADLLSKRNHAPLHQVGLSFLYSFDISSRQVRRFLYSSRLLQSFSPLLILPPHHLLPSGKNPRRSPSKPNTRSLRFLQIM